jgi:hypothetical protein
VCWQLSFQPTRKLKVMRVESPVKSETTNKKIRSPNTNLPISVSCSTVLQGITVFPSYLSSLRKVIVCINQPTWRQYVRFNERELQLSDYWALFTRKTMSYVNTVSVRLSSTCLRIHSSITRSSAQGISKGASGAVGLVGRDQGAGKWVDITKIWRV